MTFNPNELVLEKIRAVEEYDPATSELLSRSTQIESPSLKTSAESSNVTDAMGAPIMTFYNAQSGTFGYTNSLLSLDLAASQFGTKKEVADESNKMTIPVSETIAIGSDNTVTLKYVPVGTKGAEVKYVKVINENNTFGETYEVSASAAEGKFTLDAASKKITLPTGVNGRVFVNYNRETENAVHIGKSAESAPGVVSLLVHAIFHDPCNKNIVYAGVISIPRAEHDISSVELNLTPDGKHAASYKLQKPYCDADAKLFDIFVSEQ